MDSFTAAILVGIILLEVRTQHKLGRLEEHMEHLNGQLANPSYASKSAPKR